MIGLQVEKANGIKRSALANRVGTIILNKNNLEDLKVIQGYFC